jgi:hypothetical protein
MVSHPRTVSQQVRVSSANSQPTRSASGQAPSARNAIARVCAIHVPYHGSVRLAQVLRGVEILRPTNSRRPIRLPVITVDLRCALAIGLSYFDVACLPQQQLSAGAGPAWASSSLGRTHHRTLPSFPRAATSAQDARQLAFLPEQEPVFLRTFRGGSPIDYSSLPVSHTTQPFLPTRIRLPTLWRLMAAQAPEQSALTFI